jgi:hypothetical protein
MKKYLAALCGAALVIGAGIAAAQPPTGADRKEGEQSEKSASPDPDKASKQQPNKGSGGKGAAKTPPPPGADPKGGEQSEKSANPKPKN